MPLAEINRRLQNVVGLMNVGAVHPNDPNWIVNLQDLLEDAGIDLEVFCFLSGTDNEELKWPMFGCERSRLRVERLSERARATGATLFVLIQFTVQHQSAVLREIFKR